MRRGRLMPWLRLPLFLGLLALSACLSAPPSEQAANLDQEMANTKREEA